MKKRLDVLLVEQGLAQTRSKAQAMVMAGLVKGYSKAGTQVDEDAELEVEQTARYVSRGGEKLAHALAVTDIEVSGRACLDVGASTGGFTQCLLEAGAQHVVALDVGHGQLDHGLRTDARVSVLERINARHLGASDLPYRPAVVTCDVSFISLKLVLPAVLACADPGWDALALVKPQFEVGRRDAPKGVVRDPEIHRQALLDVGTALAEHVGARAVVASPLLGPKGNREFFLQLADRPPLLTSQAFERAVDDAVS